MRITGIATNMGFSTKARVTMAVGLSTSCIFLALGLRELRKSAATTIARPAAPAAVQPPMLLPLAAATRDIAIGETITASLVRTQGGEAGRNPGIAAPGEAIGKVATRPIAANSLIDRATIEGESKLAIRVPVGMRAMSIDTTAEIAVAGLVRPGDRVDVQVVYPGQDAINGTRGGAGRSHAETLLQVVPVLAVGDLILGAKSGADGAGNGGPAAATPARTVTLALTPEQVSTLSLAKNLGGLTLSLRNPSDQAVMAAAAASPRPAPTRAIQSRPGPPRLVARPGADHPIELVIAGQREILQPGSSGR